MVKSTMTLIRSCLLVVIFSILSACTTFQSTQVSATSPIVVEVTKVVKQEEPAQKEVKETKSDPIGDLITVLDTAEVSKGNFASETSPTDQELVDFISMKFLVSPEFSRQVVDLATKYSHDDFPSRNDILAIIAVESAFNKKVCSKSSCGLMQLERRSFKKKLAGRSIFDPEINMQLGSEYLNYLYEFFNHDKKAAVLAYNCGEGSYLKRRYKLDYFKKYTAHLTTLPASPISSK